MRWKIIGHRVAKHAKGFVCITHEEGTDGGRRRRRIALEAANKWAAGTEASDLVRQLEQRQPKEDLTVGDVLDLYIDKTEAITKQEMKYRSKPIKEYLGGLTPREINEDICKAYAANRARSAGTLRVELGLVNTALKWAAKHDKIPKAPFVWMPPAPPARERVLSRDEAAQLLRECTDDHLKLFVTLALQSAGRSSAILELRWMEVDLVKRRFSLGGAYRQKVRAQALPINDTLFAALTQAKEAAMTPWVIEYAGRPLKSIDRGFNAAVARAKLGRDVTPHVLRHTAASWMAADRVPFEEIAKFLGHSNPALTFKIYAKYHPDFLQKAAKSLG